MITFVKSSSQRLTSINTISPPASGTVCFWYVPLVVAAADNIWSSRPAFDMRTTAASLIAARLYSTNAVTTVSTFTIGVRVHIAATWYYVGTTTYMEIFLNGISDIASSKGRDIPTADNLIMGYGTAGYSNSKYDDFRFYNRILSADEVKTIYNCNGSDRIFSGCTNRWKMSEGSEGQVCSGTGVVIDEIGGNHLTPTNSPTWTGSALRLRRRRARI